jgi:hypothetical protein
VALIVVKFFWQFIIRKLRNAEYCRGTNTKELNQQQNIHEKQAFFWKVWWWSYSIVFGGLAFWLLYFYLVNVVFD